MSVDLIYDVEVFPNFFCSTFYDTKKQTAKVFTISWQFGIDEKNEMFDYLNSQDFRMVGYNNLYYDYRILDFINKYDGKNINLDLFKFSHEIISSGLFGFRDRNYIWSQMDLMKMMAFDKLGVGLKQISVNLKWHRVQDLPFAYDYKIKRNDISTVHDYNLNDVLISLKLYNELSEEIKLRQNLSELYNVDLISASDSKIANVLLEKFYTEDGTEMKDIRNLRTKRDYLWLRECIAPNIEFKTEKLQSLKTDLEKTLVVGENNFSYNRNLHFANCTYKLGIGGLHSDDKAAKFQTDDKFIIRDADVASYYPNIMINNKIAPKHLDTEKFIGILKNITAQRLEAKRNKDKTKANGLKITINSIFGKLGSETFWLQDAKSMLSVTVSGQLYLLMLIEALTITGIVVISANTDGIVCKIPRELEDKYYKICEWWQSKTNFSLEYTDYELYVRSDVNNYITKKMSGETKEKGRYLKKIELKKAFRYPVVPRCLYNFYVNNKSVDETLSECRDILDFCISQKCGKDWAFEYRTENRREVLQKTNRFFVSKEGGKLVKVNKKDNRESGLMVENFVKILNDLNTLISFEDYDIYYDFYKQEALKYIEEIENADNDWVLKEEKVAEANQLKPKQIKKKEDIPIMPPRFGYAKSSYYFSEKDGVIYRGISNINYINEECADKLYELGKNIYSFFVDLLFDIKEETRISKRQIDILIRLNFFEPFGGNKKLLKIYDEFFNGKNKYTKTLKEETKQKRLNLLREYEKELPDEKMSIKEQLNYENKVLGRLESTFNLDFRNVYIQDLNLTYAPRVEMYCINNGKSKTIKIKKKVFRNKQFKTGDILYCKRFRTKPSVKLVNGKWVEIEGETTTWCDDYEVINI